MNIVMPLFMLPTFLAREYTSFVCARGIDP